ncbi:MAG: pilus assembly protein TadG-related protein [Desulfovibrionaceae bacterium]|nr:pilus assembly protein TadG-related protein [Desulfovibrionaceae bacterium]
MSFMTALLIPVLVAVVGLAVDVGNLYLAQTRLQAAVDAGALAGSLELPFDPDLDLGLVNAAVSGMVEKNFQAAQINSVSAGAEVRSVCVQAEAQVNTILLGVLGIGSKTVSAKACAGFNNLEVVFVIDNTGSMKGAPIDNTKLACLNLVDLILPDGASPDTKVGLVPFRGKVKLSEAVDGFPAGCLNADGSLNQGIHPDFMDDYWALPRYLRDQITLDTCSGIPPVLPLSTDKYEIMAAINAQDARGAGSGTVISEGLKWGRHALTSEPPLTQASDSDRVRKIMILLTDGDTEDATCGGTYALSYNPNSYWTNAYYGMAVTDCHCEDGGCLNQAMLNEAQLAKDAGIEIFTVRFGSSDATDVALMKAVASSKPGTDDHYFDAPTAGDIDDMFKQIGRQLGWRLLN